MLKTLLLLLQVTQHYLVMQPLQEAIQYGRFAALAPICQQRIVLNMEAPLGLSGVMSKEQFIEEFARRFSELEAEKIEWSSLQAEEDIAVQSLNLILKKRFSGSRVFYKLILFMKSAAAPGDLQRERMETLLSPRLRNIIPRVLAAVLGGAILWLALFPAREMPLSEIQARVDKNCRRLEGILGKKVRECLRRSDSLAGAYAAGRLAASDLEKKEALIREKNGIISDYVGEIFYFKPVALANGDWRLIKKNQDVYFLRRVNPRAYYVRYFMDLKSNPLRGAAAFPYPVFDLKFSNRPLQAARDDFSYDGAQKRFYYTRVLQPSQSQLVLSLVFSRATLAQPIRRLKKILVYGLGFLLSLLVFLAFGRNGPLHAGSACWRWRAWRSPSGGRPPGGERRTSISPGRRCRCSRSSNCSPCWFFCSPPPPAAAVSGAGKTTPPP